MTSEHPHKRHTVAVSRIGILKCLYSMFMSSPRFPPSRFRFPGESQSYEERKNLPRLYCLLAKKTTLPHEVVGLEQKPFQVVSHIIGFGPIPSRLCSPKNTHLMPPLPRPQHRLQSSSPAAHDTRAHHGPIERTSAYPYTPLARQVPKPRSGPQSSSCSRSLHDRLTGYRGARRIGCMLARAVVRINSRHQRLLFRTNSF